VAEVPVPAAFGYRTIDGRTLHWALAVLEGTRPEIVTTTDTGGITGICRRTDTNTAAIGTAATTMAGGLVASVRTPPALHCLAA